MLIIIIIILKKLYIERSYERIIKLGTNFNIVLGVETSCDETSIAIIENGNKILINLVASQINKHSSFGGIVPELASRCHLENITILAKKAVKKTGIQFKNIDGIAVTQGPGLIGSLLVGFSWAKSLAWALGLPIVGINHLEGHISALQFIDNIDYPFIALLVSGGHTSIFLVSSFKEYYELGSTLDDAAGEAFDKIARLCNLSYPGGKMIEELANNGDPNSIKFPRPIMHDKTFNFSFAGLKTSVIRFFYSNKNYKIEDLLASFQEAVIDVLVNKTINAAKKFMVNKIALVGGVASNNSLRKRMNDCAKNEGLHFIVPPHELCTDNAAMIAAAGFNHLNIGDFLKNDCDAFSRLKRKTNQYESLNCGTSFNFIKKI